MGRKGVRPCDLSVLPTILRTGPTIAKWKRGKEIWIMVLSKEETEYIVQKSQFIAHLLERRVDVWFDSAGRQHRDEYPWPKPHVCLVDFEGQVASMSVERIFDNPEEAMTETANWNAFLASLPGYSVARAQPHHRPNLRPKIKVQMVPQDGQAA